MNLIEVYEKLQNANIKGESLDYNRGFFDCVELLKTHFKRYEHINLHLENRKLKRKLLVTDVNLDDALFTIGNLRNELAGLKPKIKGNINIKNGMSLIELTIADFTFDFYGNLDQLDIDSNSQLIGQYIAERLSKGRRNGIPRHATDYKSWTMQYLRDAGFKLSA